MSPSKKNEDEKSKKEDGLTEAKPLNLLNLKLGGMVKEVGSKPAKPPKTLKPGNRMTSEAAAGGITASSVASPGPPDYQGIRTAVNIGHLPNAVGRDPGHIRASPQTGPRNPQIGQTDSMEKGLVGNGQESPLPEDQGSPGDKERRAGEKAEPGTRGSLQPKAGESPTAGVGNSPTGKGNSGTGTPVATAGRPTQLGQQPPKSSHAASTRFNVSAGVPMSPKAPATGAGLGRRFLPPVQNRRTGRGAASPAAARVPPPVRSSPPISSSVSQLPLSSSPISSQKASSQKTLSKAKKKEQEQVVRSGSALYVHEDRPSTSGITKLEEDAVEDRRRLRMALFWILVCAIAMSTYVFYKMDQIKRNIKTQHEQKMKEVAAMFPRNPYEYNERQRKTYAKNFWRRFNFRNLAILAFSIMGALLVARWHRIRRVQMQRRKTVAFWLWTFLAGLLAVSWSVYIAKTSQQPIIVKQIRRNPYLRAFLYIGTILLVSLLFYAYKLKNRKSKKQILIEKWRQKKHQQMDRKAKDIRYRDLKPMKMDPLGKKVPPGGGKVSAP